jgi:hypothetical protein
MPTHIWGLPIQEYSHVYICAISGFSYTWCLYLHAYLGVYLVVDPWYEYDPEYALLLDTIANITIDSRAGSCIETMFITKHIGDPHYTWGVPIQKYSCAYICIISKCLPRIYLWLYPCLYPGTYPSVYLGSYPGYLGLYLRSYQSSYILGFFLEILGRLISELLFGILCAIIQSCIL